jgi:hypothetical protein
MGHRSKVRGKRLDQLCDDNVFYVERGKNGFLIVEGCNAAYFSTLTPVELIELGTELIKAGTDAVRAGPSSEAPRRHLLP